MNQQIRKLAAGLLVLYLALFVSLNVLQVGKKEALNTNPLNNRQTIRDFNRKRGSIITADGVVVARSVVVPGDTKFKYQREYPTGKLFAGVTGYYTYAFGSTQLEKTQHDVLMGDEARQKLNGVFGGTDNSGSVVLTMRADLQQVAADALGDREGSVVVMDPRTGAILAMVSFPSYDPNQVADHDTAKANRSSTSSTTTPVSPCSRTRTRRTTCRAPASRSSPPASRWRTASPTWTASSPRRPRGCRRRPPTRSRTTAVTRAAARWPRCSTRAATSRSHRWRWSSARRA